MTSFNLALIAFTALLSNSFNEHGADDLWQRLAPTNSQETKTASVQLVTSTGEEDEVRLFQKAQCTHCHNIPGIPNANGKLGPPLIMGTTAPKRLKDPLYKGSAHSIREYIIESILTHDAFIPKGYRATPMPMNYNLKLSASALDKMTTYLSNLQEGKLPPTPSDPCNSQNSKSEKLPPAKVHRLHPPC